RGRRRHRQDRHPQSRAARSAGARAGGADALRRRRTSAQTREIMITKLLVANRGEIAIRVLRAAADLGIPAAVVHSDDDATALPARRADEAVALPGAGPAAYLDIDQIIAAASDAGCDAIHPGYGFLSEN